MYDRINNVWVSECTEKELTRKIANADEPDPREIRFLRASLMLSKLAESNEFTAQAVAETEKLAEEKYPPALYAMAQMFEFGWGVAKDEELCLLWYKRAGEAGYRPVDGYFGKNNDRIIYQEKEKPHKTEKKKKKFPVKLVVIIAAVLAVIIAAAGIILALSGASESLVIKVNENTELKSTVSAEEFSAEVGKLLSEYDTPQMISGEVSTNRIVLKFDGNKLDLRDFLADKVVSRGNGIIVIQFADEDEARKCLEILKNNSKVIFAETDDYSVKAETIPEEYCSLSPVNSVMPGDGYYSWGVKDMGLDKLSEYVRDNFSDNEVLVAVIDTGALVHSENAHRYYEGINCMMGGDVVPDEHGTHVAGTVLDGAQCDNIKVINLDVFSGGEGASELSVRSAMELAVEIGADVINLSLGGPCNMISHDYFDEAVEKGVVLVAAAGNDKVDIHETDFCPAHVENIITVGAYRMNHEIATDYTNYGAGIDVCAPGTDIYSYSAEGDGILQKLQGTSMASPHVAALAALLKAISPDMTPAEVQGAICEYTRAFTNPTAYSSGIYGTGAPDATAFIEGY